MTDHDTAKGQEGRMDIRAAFVANPQLPERVQPADRPLHHPAEGPRPAAVFGVSPGDDRHAPPPGPRGGVRSGVVRSVRREGLETLHRTADPAGYGRNRIHQGDQLRHVVPVGAGQANGKRNALRLREDVVLRAVLPPIHRAGTRTFAPPTARTCELSTTATDRSSCPSARNRSSRTLWTLSHAPAFCQAARYRQQLMPDPQPISRGRSSHGMPLFRTNRMPVSTLRRSRGLRPGYRRRRGLGGGRRGSITLHNSSSSNGLAMAGPPCPSMTSAKSTPLRGSFC